MINVNGKEFATYDEVIAYLQEEKNKEANSKQINELCEKFYATRVTIADRTVMVCVLSNADEKDCMMLPQVLAETLLGPQNVIVVDEASKSFITRKTYDTCLVNTSTSKKIISYLLDNVDFSHFFSVKENVNIDDKVCDICFINSTLPLEVQKIGLEAVARSLFNDFLF